jgi:WhiB family transcriptional regulator, redox-sensing transcriptional regulator
MAEARLDKWWSGGACVSVDPELFFPISESGPSRRQVAQAKEICATCPVLRSCLQYAVGRGHLTGIWGGTTEEERQALRRQDPREAPARSAGGA